MPSRYIVKDYVADGIYHVYNRGVDKRDIFMDEQDYSFFLYLLKSYLLPAKEQKPNPETQLKRGEYSESIELLAYALMPNHYHFLIRQKDTRDLQEFMRSVMTSYVSYFNKKHQRTGHLFQDHYKAILVDNDDYVLHLSRYIHLNPIVKRWHLFTRGIRKGATFSREVVSAHTSYADYLGLRNTKWVKKEFLLSYFEGMNRAGLFQADKYQEFVEDILVDEELYLGQVAIDTMKERRSKKGGTF